MVCPRVYKKLIHLNNIEREKIYKERFKIYEEIIKNLENKLKYYKDLEKEEDKNDKKFNGIKYNQYILFLKF